MCRVLMDMDGVLVDFMNGVCEAHGKPNPYDLEENQGKWNTNEIWDMRSDEFLAPCESREFWEELNWTQDGREILSTAEQYVGRENVYLLTYPSCLPGAYVGKFEWVRRHIPGYENRLLMGGCKFLLSKPGHILVDDHDGYVNSFAREGGKSILVPRPWNSKHEIKSYIPKHVAAELWLATN